MSKNTISTGALSGTVKISGTTTQNNSESKAEVINKPQTDSTPLNNYL